MQSNFSFLQDKFPVLANFGGLAEQYCYSDSNSCLMKLGMIGGTIVNPTNGRPYLQQMETKNGIWFLDLRLLYNTPKTLRGRDQLKHL